MLQFLLRLGRAGAPVGPLFGWLAVIFALIALAVLLVASPALSAQWLIPTFLFSIWATACYVYVACVDKLALQVKATTLWGRVKHRMARGLAWFALTLCLASSLALVVLTVRLLVYWVRAS